MAATWTLSRSPAEQVGAAPVDQSRGRAYCGPSHGHSWVLHAAAPPPRTVELGAGSHRVTYRLVRHPRTRQPALDHWGSYLYMPLRSGLDY